jgi:hypothetical protein
MAAMQVELIRQRLASRLYDSNNTQPIKYRNNDFCLSNTSFCFIYYINWHGSGTIDVDCGCENLKDPPKVYWLQLYESDRTIQESLTEVGSYQCNTPECG